MKREDIRNYIFNENLEVKLYLDKVDVVNYKELGHFDSKQVTIYHNKGHLVIYGENLIVSKLLNNEILILGSIKKVELG